ncbi:CoA ester lyase, partial [Mesorhizobium sp. M1A.F.Ca.IN.020.06.1.1]
MRLRSLLYVPAHKTKFVEKAHTRGADAIILDLEDSVPLATKREARDLLAPAVSAIKAAGIPVFVRVNADDANLSCDLDSIARVKIDGLLLPKVGGAADLKARLSLLKRRTGMREGDERALKIIALIEDAAGLTNAGEIARASKDMFGLILGGEDFALSVDAEPSPDFLRLPKLLVHYAAKSAGIRSFGLLRTIADHKNLDAIREAGGEASRYGFDGATCVHPDVIPLLNDAFTPSADAVDRARRLLAY